MATCGGAARQKRTLLKATVAAYLVTLPALVGLDFVWLSLAADRLYLPALGDILLNGFRLAPAPGFYLVFAFGLVLLAVRPGPGAGSLRLAVRNAALLGLTARASYDLANLATPRQRTASVAMADLVWGVVLSALAGAAGHAVFA